MARTMIGLLAGLGCLAALSQAQPATGLTITVPFDQSTIQAGIGAAQPGDTVLVVPGVWSGAGNEELDFLGKDIVVMGYGPDQTIVDLGGIQNAPCVRFASGETRAAVLRDLTFRNGNCRFTSPGISVQNANPSIVNVRLDNLDGWSESGALGAALRVQGGSPLCEAMAISNGTSGGAILVSGGNPVFIDCDFTDNSSREYGSGGAAYLTGGTATFTSCRFIGNMAHVAGGALFSSSNQPVVLDRCQFEDNYIWGLWDSEESGGGAVAAVNALVAVLDCTFVNNSGDPWGGALFASGGGVSVIGSLFIGNQCIFGATLALFDANPSVYSSTIVDSHGSAILCAGTGAPQLHQLLLAGGTGVGIVAADSSAPVIECCDVFDFPAGGYGGTLADLTGTADNISQNPLFCGDLHPEQPYAISSSSPCAAENNGCGQLIGAFAPACEAVAYLVAGTVRDSAGQPLGGVEMQGLPGAPLSDANGHFAASAFAGSNLDVQPLLPGYVFQPQRVLITAIDQDWPDLEFTGSATTTHRVPADHPDIAAAILAALDGDTVLIAPGTYVGPGNRNLVPQGRDLVIRSTLGSAATIIDLEGQGRLINYDSGVTAASSLEGLTILNGDAYESGDDGGDSHGGAILIYHSSPRLVDLHIENCHASRGGALYLTQSNTQATDVHIRNCNADYAGGGLSVNGPGVYPVFSWLSISGCSAPVYGGGAIDLWASSVTFSHATIVGNATAENGGAFHVRTWQGHVVFSHCILFGNYAQHGGGIYVEDSGITIDFVNCNIFRNTGGDFGGFARAMDPAQGNFMADPLLCDVSGGLLTLDADSPCAAANNPTGLDIGAFGVGCDLPTVTLSGTLRDAAGAPLGGALVRGVDCCGTSDALGQYAIALPAGWSGDLSAWLPGYDWTPAARSYENLTSDLADQDYSAGRVTRREVPAAHPSIQSALACAADGDSVLVAPGTYTGSGNRDLCFGGRNIQLIGTAGAATTVIDCEGQGRGFLFTQGEDSTASVTGLTVRNGNSANTGIPDKGGGLLISGASPTLQELVIEDCFASESGGGIYADYAGPRLSDLVIRRCQTALEWPGGSGGGLYFAYGTPRIAESLIVDNACYVRGGGICASYGVGLQLEGLTLANNHAGTAGGGLGLDGNGCVSLAACLVSSNEAPSGGGVHGASYQGELTMSCCDVAENEGGNYGGYADDVTGEDGNIAVDPLFCEPGLGDYQLEAHSVCLPSNNSCRVQIGALGIGCEAVALPDAELPPPFALAQNHPNPFNPRTTIAFSIPAPGSVRLSVFAVDGRTVATLVDGPLAAGAHAIVWNGRDGAGRRLPSGVYHYRLEANGERAERKLLLLK